MVSCNRVTPTGGGCQVAVVELVATGVCPVVGTPVIVTPPTAATLPMVVAKVLVVFGKVIVTAPLGAGKFKVALLGLVPIKS